MPAPIPSLEKPYEEIANRIRRRLAVRGVVVAAASIVGLAAIAMSLDIVFHLPRLMRCLLFVLWIYYSVMIVRRCVVNSLRQSISDGSLAGVIESRYPAFAERLITLSSNPSGSPLLVNQLGKEVQRRAATVEPSHASPDRPAGLFVVGLGMILLTAIVAVFFIPGSGLQTRRFILPWYEPSPPVHFRVVVTSGSPVVRRGDAISLTTVLERVHPTEPFPKQIDLIIREGAEKKETILPMEGDGRGAYVLTRPNVRSDFEYAVTVNHPVKEWHTVRAADAVELTDASRIMITPPAYVQSPEHKTIAGFGEFEGVQFSHAEMSFIFNRKATAVSLEFRTKDGATRSVPVEMQDGISAKAKILLRESGQYVLTLTGDQGIKTFATAAVKVLVDSPPQFVTVVGLSNRAVEIRPVERLPLILGISDDFAVTSLELEYRVAQSNKPAVSVSIPATGLGTPLVEGRYSFDTTGKCAAGETLLIRLRATDNRNLPEQQLGPNISTFPASNWLPLRVTSSARPLAEQNIFGERDAINEHLKSASKKLTEAKDEVLAASNGSGSRTRVSDDQALRLKNARERAIEAADALVEAAKSAGLIPALNSIADDARSIVTGPLKSGVEAAKRAETISDAAPRSAELDKAYSQFAEAIRRVESTISKNDQLAKNRLDKRTLDDLAAEQKDLAKEYSKSQSGPEAQSIAARQRELRERLAAAVRESEGLRQAADEASLKKAQELAKEASQIRKDYKALEDERLAAERAALMARNTELAEKQKKIALESSQVSNSLKKSSPATGTLPPNSASANTASEKFAHGDPLSAMAEQESAAREWDRIAGEMEKAIAARIDPKESAKQIAKWQSDFASRYAEATKSQPFSQLPPHARETILTEQGAIKKAIETINVTPSLQSKKAEAISTADEITKRMAKGDSVHLSLREAAKLTATLAEKMPTRTERLQSARNEVNKILDEQANIARDASDPKKLAALSERQEKIAQSISQLDMPGMESRRDRTAASASDAARDIKQQRLQDIPASQTDIKRQLDRLKQVIDGNEPIDTLAERLANRQRQIAETASQLTPQSSSSEFDRVNELERELNRDLSNLTSPESSSLANLAKDAARSAEQASRRPMNQNPDVDELKKKTKSAADAMEKLANRMSLNESDSDRVERLLRNREGAAEKAKQLMGKPVNPEGHADAQRQVQSDLDELNQTKVGDAGKLKSDAIAKLNKLAQTPDPDRQKDLQSQAADALKQLHQAMKDDSERSQSRTKFSQQSKPDFDSQSAPGLPTADQAQVARTLAEKQRKARDEASQAAATGAGQGQHGEALRKKETELATKINSLAERAKNESQSAQMTQSESGLKSAAALNQAAEAGKRATENAVRAMRESTAGRMDSATQARNDVKSNLDSAANTLAELTKNNPTGPSSPSDTGRASQEMRKAERSIESNDSTAAQSAMKNAADALHPQDDNPQKSNSQTAPQNSGNSNTPVTADFLPPDLKKYSGTPWGELPGDVKGQIINDLRAKYGEEYSRVIKLYFEQIAEGKP